MSDRMHTIAHNIPDRSELTSSVSQNAALYGLTVEEYRAACKMWLEEEGYDDCGGAYNDVHEWLTIPHGKPPSDPIDGGRSAGAMGQQEC